MVGDACLPAVRGHLENGTLPPESVSLSPLPLVSRVRGIRVLLACSRGRTTGTLHCKYNEGDFKPRFKYTRIMLSDELFMAKIKLFGSHNLPVMSRSVFRTIVHHVTIMLVMRTKRHGLTVNYIYSLDFR